MVCWAQARLSHPHRHSLTSFKAEKVEGRQEDLWMKIMPAQYRKQKLQAEKEVYSFFPSAGRCQPLRGKWKNKFSMLNHAWENKWWSHEHPSCLPSVPEFFCWAWYEVLLGSVCVKCPSCVLSPLALLPVLSLLSPFKFSVVATGSKLSSGGFQLLFVSHAVCSGIEALWLGWKVNSWFHQGFFMHQLNCLYCS